MVYALLKRIDPWKIFKKYEDESYLQLSTMIKRVRIMPQEVFIKLLAKIYKRGL